MKKISAYQEDVKQLLKRELSHISFSTFTVEEVDQMGMAAENGWLDWERNEGSVREHWATDGEAEYSYFFATYEDIAATK